MKLSLGSAILLAAAPAAFAAPSLTFYGDTAYAVSADGRFVVGQTDVGGFRYEINGSVTNLSFPASDVNGDGSIVVGGLNSLVQWSNGTTTTLPTPVSGQVAETSAHIAPFANLTVAYTTFPFQSFVTDGSTVTVLPQGENEPFIASGISGDGTKIVGQTNDEYADGILAPVAGLAYVTSISPDGNVITGYNAAGQSAFVDHDGVHVLYSEPGYATAASDNGVVVGTARFPDSGNAPGQAFVWTEQTGAVELNQLVTVPKGWFLTYAYDVSADGSVIVGQAYHDGGAVPVGFIISGLIRFAPVPEPSSFAWSGVGALFVAITVGRKMRSGTKVA